MLELVSVARLPGLVLLSLNRDLFGVWCIPGRVSPLPQLRWSPATSDLHTVDYLMTYY